MKALAVVLALVGFTIPLAALVLAGLFQVPAIVASIDTLYEVGVLAVSVAMPFVVIGACMVLAALVLVVDEIGQSIKKAVGRG
jgi:hypothetical protein